MLRGVKPKSFDGCYPKTMPMLFVFGIGEGFGKLLPCSCCKFERFRGEWASESNIFFIPFRDSLKNFCIRLYCWIFPLLCCWTWSVIYCLSTFIDRFKGLFGLLYFDGLRMLAFSFSPPTLYLSTSEIFDKFETL